MTLQVLGVFLVGLVVVLFIIYKAATRPLPPVVDVTDELLAGISDSVTPGSP